MCNPAHSALIPKCAVRKSCAATGGMRGRSVILADASLATGATMKAAVGAVCKTRGRRGREGWLPLTRLAPAGRPVCRLQRRRPFVLGATAV